MEVLKNSEKRWLRYDFKAAEVHEMSLQLAQRHQQKATTEGDNRGRQKSCSRSIQVSA